MQFNISFPSGIPHQEHKNQADCREKSMNVYNDLGSDCDDFHGFDPTKHVLSNQ